MATWDSPAGKNRVKSWQLQLPRGGIAVTCPQKDPLEDVLGYKTDRIEMNSC